jgi:hypothetical protein
MSLYFIAIIIVIIGLGLGWVFTPNHKAAAHHRATRIDRHLKSKRGIEEMKALSEIVERHRAMSRMEKQEKKSEVLLMREAMVALKEERDFAMGAAIVPNPDSDITYEDWIHVYGREEENS